MTTTGLTAALEAFILEHDYCGERDAAVEEALGLTIPQTLLHRADQIIQ
jgi:hypothetical protein